MSKWICQDGTELNTSEMELSHLFYAYQKFYKRNAIRTKMLINEFNRRNLPLPKSSHQNFKAYTSQLNRFKVMKKLGLD